MSDDDDDGEELSDDGGNEEEGEGSDRPRLRGTTGVSQDRVGHCCFRLRSISGHLACDLDSTPSLLPRVIKLARDRLQGAGFVVVPSVRELHCPVAWDTQALLSSLNALGASMSRVGVELPAQTNHVVRFVMNDTRSWPGVVTASPSMFDAMKALTQLRELVWWSPGQRMSSDFESMLASCAALMPRLCLFSLAFDTPVYDGTAYAPLSGHGSLETFELLTKCVALLDPDSLVRTLLTLPRLRKVNVLNLMGILSPPLVSLTLAAELAAKLESFGGLPVPDIYEVIPKMRLVSPWNPIVDPSSFVLRRLAELSFTFSTIISQELEEVLLPLSQFFPALRVLRLKFVHVFPGDDGEETWDQTLVRCLSQQLGPVPFRLDELHITSSRSLPSCAASRRLDLVRRIHRACSCIRRVIVYHEHCDEAQWLGCGGTLSAEVASSPPDPSTCLCLSEGHGHI